MSESGPKDPNEVVIDFKRAKGRVDKQKKRAQKRLDAAAVIARKATADYWFNIGIAAGERGDAESEEADYREVLKSDPNHTSALINLGNVLLEKGGAHYPEAEKCYRKAATISPGYAPVWFHLGDVLGLMGKYAEAVEAYKKAIELNPRYADAYYNLACELCDIHPAQAIKYLTIYLRLAPNDKWAKRARITIGELREQLKEERSKLKVIKGSDGEKGQ